MAATSDAASDRVSISSAPSLAAFTFCCWVKIAAVHSGNLFHPVFRVDAGGGTAAIFSFRGANGRTPTLYSSSSTAGISGAEQALGTWVFLAVTMSAGGAAQLFYGTTPGSLTKVTGTVNTNGTPSGITLFGRSPSDASEWLEGSMAHDRIWTAVLSDAEIAAESLITPSLSAPAARTSGLWTSVPFAAASLADVSGNHRDFTAGTTALTPDTDPPTGGIQQGVLSSSATAWASFGAFSTRPRTLAVAATASAALTPVHEQPTALPVVAVPAATLTPTRTTSAVLAVSATARAELEAFRDAAGSFVSSASAQVLFAAAREQPVALAAAAVATAGLANVQDRAATLAVSARAETALATAREKLAVLDAASRASAGLVPGSATSVALTAVATAQGLLAGFRAATAALGGIATSQFVLSPIRDAPAALIVVVLASVLTEPIVPGRVRDITVSAQLLPSRYSTELLTSRWTFTEV
ncbi:LamG-like jellyroll fold domain-containing protein [Amycolatopsis sp. NPDC004368]